MADFTTWSRETLEQFAREATEKLIENKAAIEELSFALSAIRAHPNCRHEVEAHLGEEIWSSLEHESTTKKEKA